MSPDRADAPATGKAAGVTGRATVSALEARFRLIEKLMELNSRQLRCDSALGGAEIELARLRRDAALPGAAAGLAAALRTQASRLAALEDQRRRLLLEREWLDAVLAEFDAGEVPPSNRAGRA